ncbi:inositol monophosphatase 1-like isoform X2 [Amphiura filiformis]|uniref:inositol monophosphatase 1-like isoform X2 n=1 Tax=Amphiura filiformis TaxID=82378 RepID=UPI003B211565
MEIYKNILCPRHLCFTLVTAGFSMGDVSEEPYHHYLKKGIDVAKTAGKEVQKAFFTSKTTSTKSDAWDLVTETDKLVEKIIVSSLQEAYPTHSFIGEESTAAAGQQSKLTDNPTWIIDPIDGTTNFVHSFPFSTISIGLTINKELVVGIVYNPMHDEMYTATKGGGAFCNGHKIRVSRQEDIQQSIVSATVIKAKVDGHLSNIRSLITAGIHGTRNVGSAALALSYIASGSLDALYDYGLHSWDVAAGILIVHEAGGVTIDPTNNGPVNLETPRIVAASSMKLALSISHLITDPYV